MDAAINGIKAMLLDALQAVQGADKLGQASADEIERQACHPALKRALQQGTAVMDTWQKRLQEAGAAMGNGSEAHGDNPVIAAINEVGSTILSRAPDAVTRDLGIIATGQLALHYFIWAFGTMHAYAQAAGEAKVAALLAPCLEEAKQGDRQYTRLAGEVLGQR